MEGGSVGLNFERDPPKDHPCQVGFNLVQGFQRRRFKCESLDIRQIPSDGKSSHGLWSGELKRVHSTATASDKVYQLLDHGR